ncbi:hypothetical protein CVD25_10095 [Bacillus canaveralius]|uniref:Uncharacterized protein n=1 Tax=Bacillus canaveralius TaxID=1403243 RepID=A0A2N5GMC3_9BACI|nr:hypothetical protein [Bacillus canaveralius]PLR83012.1 hypothetical protein CU635_11105 [Bacillus canaveralius]PLR96984.1 hypothetical protein CVD25_10095 [Bacillus canaveralius]RSK47921.1 hypothetical protein EJA13_17760 [Bacillus canaveralius]
MKTSEKVVYLLLSGFLGLLWAIFINFIVTHTNGLSVQWFLKALIILVGTSLFILLSNQISKEKPKKLNNLGNVLFLLMALVGYILFF